jgi:glucose-6-phosphate-specific signal transduction histidine kinase
MKKTYLTLFIVSIIAILFLEDGMVTDFSLARFGQPFMFISFPFILALFFGWRKGFLFSVLTSAVTLLIVSLTSGQRDFWLLAYGAFFASFSIIYLLIGIALSNLMKRNRA